MVSSARRISCTKCTPIHIQPVRTFANPNSSAINLIVSFAIAVKHKLRFEPGIDYADLKDRIFYLETFAKAAEADIPKPKEHGRVKAMGEYLGVTFAESNPRKRVKNSKKPLGNLPLELLNHLAAYVQNCCENETLKNGLYQSQASTC
jgi:putative membrane protein